MREEDQERVLTEAVSRIAKDCADAHEAGHRRFDEALADSVYYESHRLKSEKKSSRQKEDAIFWSKVPALGLLLNAVSPAKLLGRFGDLPSLDDAVIVQGETEQLRRLREIGTVILVPTHVSNLDSLVIGYALHRMGLPPFIYGAGLNLFSNPLMGFFMHNLGAYTVDRRKKDPLYKAALKEYATLTLEHGYDNIFFPGGTRSRSGATEQRLKLGLLGTGVRAYTHNLIRGAKDSKIFIVPATLSFQLVLEAETLVDDFLKEQGKSRYIISDDEFAKPKRIYDFAKQLMSLDSKIYVTFSRAIDPFGNDVDDEGHSLDPCGREVDPTRFVWTNREPTLDRKREALYTKRAGARIADAFARDSVIQATHLTAWCIFSLMRKQNFNVELIRLCERAIGCFPKTARCFFIIKIDSRAIVLSAVI